MYLLFNVNTIMNLKKILSIDLIKLNLKSETKNEIIEELLNVLMTTGKIKDREAALNSLLEREKKMSTGIQHGVAIPHGKTNAVDELIACIGIKKEGVDFESLDNKPSTIFIMTLSPLNRTGPHVQFLAEISQILKSESQRKKLLMSKSEEDVLLLVSNTK